MNKKSKKARAVKANPPRKLRPNMLPAPRRWMLDVDYWDKLDPEETRHLSQFLDEYYRADRRYEKPMHDKKHETGPYGLFAAQNANARDAYSYSDVGGRLGMAGLEHPNKDASASVVDFYTSPAYLNKMDYKEARDELRRLTDVEWPNKEQRERIKMLQEYLMSITRAS